MNTLTNRLSLVVTLSLVSGTALCHKKCDPSRDFNLNYRIQYHDVAPKRTDYSGFRDVRMKNTRQVAQHVRYPAPKIDTVSHQRTQVQTCAVKHEVSPPKACKKQYQVSKQTTHSPKFKMTYTVEKLPPFDNIVADGNTQVVLNGSNNYSVKATSKSVYPEKLIDIRVKNRTLLLSRRALKSWKDHARQTVVVNVSMPRVHQITLKDQARINANDIRTLGKGLVLRSHSAGNSQFKGNVQLAEVCNTGPGNVNIQWVSGDMLRVMSSSTGHINLAGTIDTINVRACECSHVDAKYLRAHNALVQTADKAQVDITAIQALSGFASDFSNIRYYKTPHHLTRHVYCSGNVMQMRYWN